MTAESIKAHGITLYSHTDDLDSHWIRYVLAEKQIQYHLILIDDHDEDVASLNPYNRLPMLIENELKLFNTAVISEYIDDRYRQNKLYADTPALRAEQRQYIWRLQQDWFKLAYVMCCHADSMNIVEKTKAQRSFQDTLISLTPLFQYFPFFMSETFSILDCMLAPIFLRLNAMGIQLPKQQAKAVYMYQNRLLRRPAFLKSLTLQEKNRYQDHIIEI